MMPADVLGLPAHIEVSYAPQGSDEWHDARRGVCTGSRAKDARDHLADKPEKPEKVNAKTGEITLAVPAQRGAPSGKQSLYARDLARARESGRVRDKFQTFDMRAGQVEEPNARLAYELLTGCLVEELGFVYTTDRKFGVSPDGLRFELDADGKQVRGAIEIKTMLSSDTLFKAFIGGDTSDYIDQIDMEIWLLELDWVDLVLWAPDLPEGRQMRVIRIERDQDRIDALVEDLMAFDKSVETLRATLLQWINDTQPDQSITNPVPAQAAPAELPEDIFA